MSERQFEIVLYGASGFTGKLVAEYLAEKHTQLNWAIAGRDERKLDGVRRELGVPDLPIVIADSGDADQLSAMARQTRTLISTVGPYAQFGTPVIEACATEGTHYCDLTGEAQWMAQVYERINPIAQASGARLIHSCGFDSVPSDLSVCFLQQRFKERFGHYATHVAGRMGEAAGGVSGGTVASLMYVAEQASKDPAIRELVMDPYALYPASIQRGLDVPDQSGISWDDHFESWTGPFVMAAINTKVVRRSHALAGLRTWLMVCVGVSGWLLADWWASACVCRRRDLSRGAARGLRAQPGRQERLVLHGAALGDDPRDGPAAAGARGVL